MFSFHTISPWDNSPGMTGLVRILLLLNTITWSSLRFWHKILFHFCRQRQALLPDQLTKCKHELQTNTEVKPYVCKHCNIHFSDLSNCERHEQTRVGVNSHTCKHCKKYYSHLSNREQHEQTHIGVKPYVCKHCKISFSGWSNCKQHERTHAREKPYTCKHCKNALAIIILLSLLLRSERS